ncbi:MAG: DUF4349 domain-containing protein [Bacteroidales bacterium]
MKKQLLMPIIISAFIAGSMQLSGCGSKSKDQNFETSKKEMTAIGQKEELVRTAEQEKNLSNQSDQTAKETEIKAVNKQVEQKIPSKIIKTADISMQVKDYKESRKAILAIVQKSGAYIAAENQANRNYNIANDMTIRIKPEGFDDLLDKIIEQSVYVDSKKITAQDVTADYMDTEARLKSKRDVEVRYSEILKKANTIKDILEVEEKLRQIREEIESCEGKLKYLTDQVSYSTINLHFYEKLDFQPAPGSGFFHAIGKAFKAGWKGLQMFMIGIIYLWPLWIIAAIIFYVIRWFIKKSRKKKLQK